MAASGAGDAGGADVALSLPKARTATATLASSASAVARPRRRRPPRARGGCGRAARRRHRAAGVASGRRRRRRGWPAADADLDQVNLAAPVTDGERVYVPRHGEVGVAFGRGVAGATRRRADAIVNINDADETQLEALPGVGPATAKAIVDYRSEHGRFRSVDDLLNVRGIGPAKLSQIKPHARV